MFYTFTIMKAVTIFNIETLLFKFNFVAMRSLSLTIIILSVITLSCKDKKKEPSICEKNPAKCETVSAAKSYFLFNYGSWWVYQEENSGMRDSVYVTEYNNSGGYDFDMRVYSTHQDYYYHFSPFYAAGNTQCSAVYPVSTKCVYIKRSKYKPGNYIGENDCLFINYKLNDIAGSFNINHVDNVIKVVDIWDNYSLNNLSFGKTVKVFEQNTFIEGDQTTNHYFSKNVGLIRKELVDSNQVWNLVEYHIEP